MNDNLKTWPEKMFFQWTDDDSLELARYESLSLAETMTYCHEKINKSDVKYIRSDIAKEREEKLIIAAYCHPFSLQNADNLEDATTLLFKKARLEELK